MANNNKIILGLLAFAIVFSNATPSQAQEVQSQSQSQSQAQSQTQSPTKTQQAANNTPIVIEANELSLNDETGDILAKGKVVITQNGQRLETEQLDGNTKLSEIWIKDKLHFTQPGTALDGTNALFNYKLNTGSMEHAKGKVDKQYISGEDVSIFPEKITALNATTTNCPAKVPDYHVSADKIEIWPGDYMIAYNAKFWIKDKVIFTLPKYRQSLKKDAQSQFPSFGYDNDDGFYIKQHVEYPVTQRLAAYVNLDYYTKARFKPSYGLIDYEKNYSIGVAKGHFRDDDGHWIKKEPEFKFYYYPHRLGEKSPVSYTFTAIYGKWIDSAKTSWHQDYNLYFTRDPIKLDDRSKLYLGTGVEQVRESYNKSVNNIIKYDATVDRAWSDKLYTWVGYHYTQNNSSLFAYGSTSVSRELASGFSYKIDKMNTISVAQSYDLNAQKVADLDYTWNRNLHCWQATITYRAKREQIRFDLSTTRW